MHDLRILCRSEEEGVEPAHREGFFDGREEIGWSTTITAAFVLRDGPAQADPAIGLHVPERLSNVISWLNGEIEMV